ncbi:unnamed protein product [Symbiodinium natans]|uniref:Saposin B-type domain-containing protein n=1 Tax=Symbiodinium natans TaxID=878477 RepID=A0A812HNQ2_9DINO|nr:unnamed protein product [Symbiodinium natans]
MPPRLLSRALALLALASAQNDSNGSDFENAEFNYTNRSQVSLSACPPRSTESDEALAATGLTGPELWGNGLDPGPSSFEDRSAAYAEWRTSVAPERQRFARLGPSGPPTFAGRRLAVSLARGLGCNVCQQLLNVLWDRLHRPSATNMGEFLDRGCPALVKDHLLKEGWAPNSGSSCAGARTLAADGEPWCLIQDPLSSIAEHPHLAENYDPGADSLILACENTIAKNRGRVITYLTAFRDGAPARARNEYLMRAACVEAACCSSF